MKSVLIISIIFTTFDKINAQSIFKAQIKDSLTNEPLYGVSVLVQNSNHKSTSFENGIVIVPNIPAGQQTFILSHVGYYTKEIHYVFKPNDTLTVQIWLVPGSGELEEIIIQGMRSNRTIANTPTRVEVLTEEIDEASTMDPSKIAHLLTHSTGIQVQQTSATSNTANVRIQGLDGRYTQILKDGFPLYGGFSGSLSIMQIPPLDLRQIEYIKGGASTLYGGGAISGLINLISKQPESDESLFHLNASHVGAFDANVFVSRKIDKIGFTLLAQRNTHKSFDADKDGFSDLPRLTKFNINPKLFFYFGEKSKLSIGATFTNEKRQGGDVNLMNNEYASSTHFYKEVNDISRSTTQVKFEKKLGENHTLTFRNSFNFFDRRLLIIPSFISGEYRFAGKQVSSFSEGSYTYSRKKNVLITGINFYTDDFKETPIQSSVLRNEGYKTVGVFGNYTFDLSERLAVESGLRIDKVLNQKMYVLPRLSALFKWSRKLTTRMGAGFGYRTASIFNQEAELLGYKGVMPINRRTTTAEQSYGGSIDIGYKAAFGEHYTISFNQMFFYTYLDKPLVLREIAPMSAVFNFENANGYTKSAGAETFFKFGFYHFMLFAGYTYTDANNYFNGGKTVLTLTPKHSLKGDLLYAMPGKWRIGLDYEYKSRQVLNNGNKSRSLWTFGALLEYSWKNYTFFGNVENYTNVRQTNFGTLVSGPYNTPQFTDVWAPLDGIVFNYGLKVRL